jgi:hypothetical protein
MKDIDELENIIVGSKNKGIHVKETNELLTPSTPLFPIEGFPSDVQEMITSCATTYGTPRDYWAGAVLIASALAIGNKLELVTNYKNIPVLWLVLLGDVSSGKSNPLDFCLDYFKKLDCRSFEEYEEDLTEINRISGMTVKERLVEGICDKPSKPEYFQYILNDFTPEAMVEAHKTNNRGLLIERDELKGWIDDFGRYNKSGEQSNMLSSWSGIGITYNRKTSGIMSIQHPCIMVCGGMQPDLLPSLAANNRAENGFLSRFCCVYPDNTQKAGYNNKVFPEKIRTDWEEYLTELLYMTKLDVRLGRDAEEKYSAWYNFNAQMTNDESTGYLKGVYGKLDIISLRLSIVIRGMKMACNVDYSLEITGEDMKAALALTEYFRATALKVYRKLFANEGSNIDKKLMANYLYKERGVNKKDISLLLGTSRSQLDRMLA